MERTGILPNCKELTYEIVDNELYPFTKEKCWGLSMADCLRMLANHMDGDTLEKEKVEFVLEDCNFHTFNKLLNDEQYIEAMHWILKEYAEEE